MAVETRTHLLDVGASGVNVLIERITAADDERITILETGYYFGAAGFITAARRNENVDDVNSLAAPDVNHRVVRNIVLERGDYYEIRGNDTSAGANIMGMVIVQDREKVK